MKLKAKTVNISVTCENYTYLVKSKGKAAPQRKNRGFKMFFLPDLTQNPEKNPLSKKQHGKFPIPPPIFRSEGIGVFL